MRKLFFFLSLLLAVGTAGAQGITDLGSISNSKTYTLKNERAGYLKADENTLWVTGTSGTQTDGEKFALIKLDDSDFYYLYSTTKQKFVVADNTADGFTIYSDTPNACQAFMLQSSNFAGNYNAESGEYDESSSKTYYPWHLVCAGSNNWMNQNGYGVSIGSYRIEDEGNGFCIEEAGDFAEAETLIETIKANYLPFTTTTISGGQFAENTTWYTLQTRNYYWGYLKYVQEGVVSEFTVNGKTYTNTKTVSYDDNNTLAANRLFCFVKGGNYNEVQVYSLASGAESPLGTNIENGSISSFGNSENTTFTLKANANPNGNSVSGFSLNIASADASLNWFGGGTILAVWNDNISNGTEAKDDGSCLWVSTPDQLIADVLAMTQSDNRVGGYRNLTENFTNAQSAYSSSKTPDNLKALCDAYQAEDWQQITLTEGMPYKIHFDRGSRYTTLEAPYADAEGNITNLSVVANYTGEGLQALWFFTPSGNTNQYYITPVNAVTYGIGIPTSSDSDGGVSLTNVDAAPTFSIQNGERSDQKILYINSSSITDSYNYFSVMNVSDANAKIGRYLKNWGSSIDAGNKLYIEEVPSIEVAISEAKYATLNLPFAVSIPDGVKVTYISNVGNVTNNVAILTEQEITGVIPANTPVILYSETAGTKTFDVYTGSVAAIADNQLFGTTLERQGMTSGSFYALANGSHGVGLYRADVTEAPANKAYMEAAKLTEAQQEAAALLFWNGGEVTGIDEAQKAGMDESNTFFDLNGRRVLYPTRGIYVNAKGQKVLVK